MTKGEITIRKKWYEISVPVEVPKTLKFTIDCQQPADDNIIEPKENATVHKHLHGESRVAKEGSEWSEGQLQLLHIYSPQDFEKFLTSRIKAFVTLLFLP